MFQGLNKFILDTLFPVFCLSCKKENHWLCDQCLEKIEIPNFQVCPYCEKEITPKGTICQKCKSSFLAKGKIIPLDALVVSSSYKNTAISKIIHLLKYNFAKDLGDTLGQICQRAFSQSGLELPDIIVPIPLHPKRLRWRGFNQSELIANNIAQNICPGFPLPVLAELTIRQKYTPPQMKIRNYQERKNNLREAFALNPKIPTSFHDLEIKNKHILIVDDVATTGATLFELGKLLKTSGAKKVSGLVAARQEVKK